jgi:two-component system, NarL family, invasion response regulator UvrY
MRSSAQHRAAEAGMARSLRILIVDDSAPFGDLAAALLAREPLVELVGVARSGGEGLELTAALKPDLVLMDVQMSPMGGLTATALIGWLFPRSRVVMMSTEDAPRLRAQCAAAGAQAFIHKSNFIAEFLVAVAPVAREGRTRQGRSENVMVRGL